MPYVHPAATNPSNVSSTGSAPPGAPGPAPFPEDRPTDSDSAAQRGVIMTAGDRGQPGVAVYVMVGGGMPAGMQPGIVASNTVVQDTSAMVAELERLHEDISRLTGECNRLTTESARLAAEVARLQPTSSDPPSNKSELETTGKALREAHNKLSSWVRALSPGGMWSQSCQDTLCSKVKAVGDLIKGVPGGELV